MAVVFETIWTSYHLIAPSRGRTVIEQVLGEAEPEVWISDCFRSSWGAAAYATLAMVL